MTFTLRIDTDISIYVIKTSKYSKNKNIIVTMNSFELINESDIINSDETSKILKEVTSEIVNLKEEVSNLKKQLDQIKSKFIVIPDISDIKQAEEIIDKFKMIYNTDEWLVHFNNIPPKLLQLVNDLYFKYRDNMSIFNYAAYHFYLAGFSDLMKLEKKSIIYMAEYCDVNKEIFDDLFSDGYISLSDCEMLLEKYAKERKIDMVEYWIQKIKIKKAEMGNEGWETKSASEEWYPPKEPGWD